MAEKKKKLNKGLDAIFGGDITSLIDDIENNTPESSQEKIHLDEIRPNPYQPRKVFDEQALNELALSIKEHGIFQPVILKKSVQGYEIVAGERRCRAARMAHLEEVPAIIVDFSDQQMMEIALLENIQREDLNAIEEAQAYQTMMEKLKLTQNELAKRIGKSRTHITNTLRLLNLPEKIQEYVLDGSLSMGHARALITLDKERALKIAKRVIDEKLSVRDVENIVKGFELQEARKNKPKVEKSKEYQRLFENAQKNIVNKNDMIYWIPIDRKATCDEIYTLLNRLLNQKRYKYLSDAAYNESKAQIDYDRSITYKEYLEQTQ